MQENTDSRRRKKKDALFSAVLHTAVLAFIGVLLLDVRHTLEIGGLPGAILSIFALLDWGTIVPIWITFKERIKEIEGGEEDAAAQY